MVDENLSRNYHYLLYAVQVIWYRREHRKGKHLGRLNGVCSVYYQRLCVEEKMVSGVVGGIGSLCLWGRLKE